MVSLDQPKDRPEAISNMIRESQSKAMDRVFQLFTLLAQKHRKTTRTSIFNALAFTRYAQIYVTNLVNEPERITKAADRDTYEMLIAGELHNQDNLVKAIQKCIEKNFKGEPEVLENVKETPAEL